MPRTLTPAIRKSDALEVERKASPPRIPTREDVEPEAKAALGQVWWHGDGEPEGAEDVGHREAAAAFRRGK